MRKALVAARNITAWDDAPMRDKIFHIFDRGGVDDLEEPQHVTILRWVTFVVMLLFVCLVCINIVISSLPEYAQQSEPFLSINFVCVVYFTAEYLLRFVCAPDLVDFFFNILNLQDLISILPFYLTQAGLISEGISNWVLITRSLRLVRGLFNFSNFDIVMNTVGESSEVITLMVLIMIVGLPFGGQCMHYAERGIWNSTAAEWYRECFPPDECEYERTPFQTAVDGMWYFIVTVTTLGYGDMAPTSRAGKIFGGLLMGVGVMLLAYPIMILAVNFEEERRKEEREKTLGKVANGERLRLLQKANTVVLDDEDDNPWQRPMPVYFYPKEVNQPRPLILIGPNEVRYDPLFNVQRNRDGSLYMLQSVKTSLEVTIRLVFDTAAAQKLALQTMAHFSAEDEDFKVQRARFFPVVRMMFHLDIPQSRCEFLNHLRLVNHVIEDVDLDTMRMPVAMELNGFDSQLDDQRKLDFHQALHRCRLHMTAFVAYDDPIFFDVPIFLGLLSATALLREMQARKQGVVYITIPQIEQLLNGIHHLLDLNQSEHTVIINAHEIRKQIARAIVLRAASVCEDPQSLKSDAFLYGYNEKETEPYHGVFVTRLTKKVNSRNDDSEYVLCNVKVLAVKPKPQSMVLLL